MFNKYRQGIEYPRTVFPGCTNIKRDRIPKIVGSPESKTAGADAGFRVRGGASGVSRISARGVLKVRPHTKSVGGGGGGGGGASGPIYEKWGGGGGGRFRSDIGKVGGGGALQVRYRKSGGGGGGGGGRRFRSDIRKVGGGGGAIPLQVRYLWAHRKYLHVPTYVLPRYTSHARANACRQRLTYYNFFVIHMLGGACALHAPPPPPPKSATELPRCHGIISTPNNWHPRSRILGTPFQISYGIFGIL